MQDTTVSDHINVEQPRLHEELLAILDRTLDARTARDGMRIYSEPAAKAVRRSIFIRRFAPLVIQAVHLARLADLCRPGRYEMFVGGMVRQRADAFRGAVANAPHRPDAFRIAAHGVELAEPAQPTGKVVALAEHRARRGEAFVLYFARMPAAAAMLDVLHDALGFAEVSSLLLPCLGPTATVPVREVAATLAGRFDTWLKPRMASDYHIRQAQLILSFLCRDRAFGLNDLRYPDNELIFAFWQFASLLDVDLGFRLFRYAAAALLRYVSAAQINRMRDTVSLPEDEPTEDQPTGGLPDSLRIDEETGDVKTAAFVMRTWTSPLGDLCEPPPKAVKWLMGTECRWLRNLMGGAGGCADADTEADDRPGHDAALCSDRPLPLSLVRTLLRVDVFGPIQDRLGGRHAPDIARSIDDAAETYASAVAKYRRIHAQLRREARAALDALLRHGRAGAIPLLRLFLPHVALGPFLAAPEPPASRESAIEIANRVARNIQAQRQHDPARGNRELEILLREAAQSGCDRTGFRKQDDGDPACLSAMADATEALEEATRILAAVFAKLGSATLDLWWREDCDLFARQFTILYRGDRSQ